MAESRPCSVCGNPILEGRGFDFDGRLFCASCFCKKAEEHRQLEGKDKKRLSRAVKEEMAGILPREALKELLEDGCHDLIQEADTDPILNRMVNEIERMCGLAMCREILNVIQGLQGEMGEQEEEIRKKIRKLAEL